MTEVYHVKCPQINDSGPYRWLTNIGSSNGLVLSGNKPSPEHMLTQIYVAILASLGHNELTSKLTLKDIDL